MRMMHAPTLRVSSCDGIPEALILLRTSESNFGNESRGRSVFWAARYNGSGDHGVVVLIHRCGAARSEVCCRSLLGGLAAITYGICNKRGSGASPPFHSLYMRGLAMLPAYMGNFP